MHYNKHILDCEVVTVMQAAACLYTLHYSSSAGAPYHISSASLTVVHDHTARRSFVYTHALLQLSQYKYSKAATGAAFRTARTRLLRLAHEHADLSESLPLTLSSSVWVRTLDGSMDCMQVCILRYTQGACHAITLHARWVCYGCMRSLAVTVSQS
jgi:hypothetical protein